MKYYKMMIIRGNKKYKQKTAYYNYIKTKMIHFSKMAQYKNKQHINIIYKCPYMM